jgi:hypothetical protein
MWVFAKALLTLVAATSMVAGIVWLGDLSRQRLSSRERYLIHFADIDCNPPPGTDRESFLAEVRYVAKCPESFQIVDPEFAHRLTAAFSQHPWVAAVERVSADPSGKVRVNLKHRTPALGVPLTNGQRRVVDATGVLLPLGADVRGLPELITPLSPPTTAAGQVWADPTLRRALDLLAAHHPRAMEKTTHGWRLMMADGKVFVVEQ